MHPLPNCATGEWGPTKARRHFGLEPLSHTSGLINVETVVELRLRQPRPLQYVFRLRFNDVDDSLLKRSVRTSPILPAVVRTTYSLLIKKTYRKVYCGCPFGLLYSRTFVYSVKRTK